MTRMTLWCVVLVCRLCAAAFVWGEGVAMDRIGQLDADTPQTPEDPDDGK